MTPVVSSNLAAVGYDSSTNELYVQFPNGAVYCYFRVPQAIYTGLMAAPSHGEFLNDYVKKAGYGHTEIV